MRNRAVTRFLLVFLLAFAANLIAAPNLDRLFVQRLDENFFSDLTGHAGSERAIFVELAGVEKVFYLRHTSGHFILHTSLSEAEEKLLQPQVFTGKTALFSPLKQNGEPLYEKGIACISESPSDRNSQWQYLYVPFNINGRINDAFVSDLGYLKINIDAAYLRSKSDLAAILKGLFGNNAKICREVRLNRYYLFRDNYYGPVELIKDRTSDNVIFPPVHKATLNKSVSDWVEKSEKDRKLVIDLIADEKHLYSQDMRLKLGMVPGFVKINWQFLDNTDIGSGQNHLVFLSTGPGINYFDNPWKQPEKNIPCPRLYFHKDIVNLERIQLYPTYSIEPKEKGTGRLAAINIFQQTSEQGAELHKKVIWSSSELKASLLPAIEESLCQYGLTNSSSDLEPGFVFKRCFFNGNVVNNEIRVYQTAAVRDYMTAAIVPPDSAKSYRQAYQSEMINTCDHWEYNCGVHFSRLFVEAMESTDRGFRETWLMMLLKESHPTLFRIMHRARQHHKIRAFSKIADKASALAQKQGRKFFLTPHFSHYQALSNQKYGLWLEYLESYRNGDKLAPQKFKRFTEFYRYLEKICD
ncbi:MAG: hypothetical protein GX569_01270 [Candidatus Riflebacteria bacterium]|nr:hypothetical protein [Candidatus Riflebacteria bacterium]